MNRVEKALAKLGKKERQNIKEILLSIDKGDFRNLDTKKLKNKDNIFRVRKGNIRIIFWKVNNSIKILAIERRKSKTYQRK